VAIEDLLKALSLLVDALGDGHVVVWYEDPAWCVWVKDTEYDPNLRAQSMDLSTAVAEVIVKASEYLEMRVTRSREALGSVTSALMVARDYGSPPTK